MTVCLYGRTTNWGSHAQVTEGFRLALEHHGELTGLVPIDLAVDEELVAGRSAQVGLLTGALRMMYEISPTHRIRAAVVAPNSSRIPSALAKAIDQHLHLVLAPSKWAEEVLKRELTTPRVITVPHGVHPDMVVQEHVRSATLSRFNNAGDFKLLHFSTTDRGRKGTMELVKGWALARPYLPASAELVMVLDPNARARLVDDVIENGLVLDGITCAERISTCSEHRQPSSRAGTEPRGVGLVMAMYHCVIQPSRGEGFGLIPLEARACGIPVIATTNATGHREHLLNTGYADGVVSVPAGPDAPIDDVPGAMAPTVEPKDIAEAILKAHESYDLLHENAMEMAKGVQERWSWPRVVRPFIEEVVRDE